MKTYNFSTWQIDGKDSRSLVKLKEWWFKKPDSYLFDEENDGIDLDKQGHLYVECGNTGGVVYFPATLLPYFFDEQGIVGWIRPHDDDWEIDIIQDTHRGVFRKTRLEADHALYTRMFQLLEERLTNN